MIRAFQTVIFFALAILGILVVQSCGTGQGTAITLTHSGIDFTAKLPCDDATVVANDSCDGETILWSPQGTPTAARDAENIWFRNSLNFPENRVADLGAIGLADVAQASIPSSWPADAPHVQVGHVFIAQTQDGYVAFIVKSFDAADGDWPVEVEFIYSADGTTWE